MAPLHVVMLGTGAIANEFLALALARCEGAKLWSVLSRSSPKFRSRHDESMMLSMRFEDGATAEVFASVLFRAPRRGELFGDESSARAEGTLGPWGDGTITVRDEVLEYTPMNPYIGELEDFAGAVRKGKAPAVDGHEALRNVELLARAIP
jgi:predicted dehydrogenase